jgi:hypothetical protein
MRYTMRKPYRRSMRHYVGAVNEMNAMLIKLPPGFNNAQKISDTNMIDKRAVLAPRKHKNLMIEQGFDPRTATIETYVEICERAETKGDVHKETKTRKNAPFTSDDDESDGSYKKKKKEKKKEYRKREEYFCKKYHGPNPTHDGDTCKVLLAKGQDKPA